MKSKNLIKFPLSLLRAGRSEFSASASILWTAVRNVGIGFQKTHAEIEFQALVEQGEECWNSGAIHLDGDDRENVCVGAALLGLDRLPCGSVIQDALNEAERFRDTPFVALKQEFLWALLLQYPSPGRPELPVGGDDGKHRLSWREFRVLSAIISGKVNRYGFTLLGWETIAARASGFFRKEDAWEVANREEGQPKHSELLSRSKVCTTVQNLEALRFFMRFRYSRGLRGGFSAYSIRHANREALAESVFEWSGYKRDKVAANRKEDLKLCKRLSRRNID